MTYRDGLVGFATDDGKWVFTSPNANWIPQPVFGHISVAYREDGRCGTEDPIQWPQLFCHSLPHLAVIMHRPKDPADSRQPIWRAITMEDFVPLKGSVVSCLGTLSAARRMDLRRLVDSMAERVMKHCYLHPTVSSRLNFCDTAMRNAAMRLDYPATYRDIVLQAVNVQRYWLECMAWLDWVETLWDDFFPTVNATPPPLQSQYMGAFTTDPAVAQKLLSAGIPVWLMRHPDMITADVVIRHCIFTRRLTSG